jgi:hypothetical protein
MAILNSLSTLSAAYYQLLFMVMLLVLESAPNPDATCDFGVGILQTKLKLSDFFDLYNSILGAEDPLNDAIPLNDTVRFISYDHPQQRQRFKGLTNSFLLHLRICDDATIATQLLETLSLFSIHSESDSLSEMVDISWRALHSNFSSGVVMRSFRAPFAFLMATRQSIPSMPASPLQNNAAERSVQATVVKLAFSKSKNAGKKCFLVNGMLRHWGLLALATGKGPSLDDHLYQLLSNLQNYLGEVQEPLTRKLSAQRQRDTSDEDGEYLPPRPQRLLAPVLPKSQVPGLSATSFLVYFDALLQMTIAAVAIISVAREAECDASQDQKPFQRLENLVEIFGSLIELYKERLGLFPRSFLATVVNASKNMLSVAMSQLRRCIEWRNSQPVLSRDEIEAGARDLASVGFLKELLDAFGVNLTGRLQSLFECLDSPSYLAKGRAGDEDTDYLGTGDRQKLKTLRVKAERFWSELQKIALAHNLAQPELTQGETEVSSERPKAKRRRIEVKGLLQFEPSSEESTQPADHRARGSNIRESGASISNVEENHKVLQVADGGSESLSSSVTSDGSSSSESSEFFGASGDWGEGSDPEESRLKVAR